MSGVAYPDKSGISLIIISIISEAGGRVLSKAGGEDPNSCEQKEDQLYSFHDKEFLS